MIQKKIPNRSSGLPSDILLFCLSAKPPYTKNKNDCQKLKSSGWHPEKILLVVFQKLFAGAKLDSVFVETIGFVCCSRRHIET